MCLLYQDPSAMNKFTGYKVVFVSKDGKRYSPATGLCYDSYRGKDLPVKPRSKRLSNYFLDVLDPNQVGGWKRGMQGKSAVFRSFYDADSLYRKICSRGENLKTHLRLTIVRATVSKDLREGWYDDAEVVAGQRIRLSRREEPIQEEI